MTVSDPDPRPVVVSVGLVIGLLAGTHLWIQTQAVDQALAVGVLAIVGSVATAHNLSLERT
jgi:hypothetical protein